MSATYALPPEMTIYAAADLRTTFQAWVQKSSKARKGKRAQAALDSPLVVDASAVTEIDSAGLQLLIALSRSVAASSRRLELDQPSQALQTACATLGLSALLGGAEAVQ